ncbi:histidine kinase [Prauserella marina]|uniref:histidine kinase n=1 Tax=Prauserella marina TaxID=530584 RepID=A0A222VT83_9PSEU|nr:sensor histidine kinase [Prauserella marina]ASR37118.1 histidine kinase [Prauserella marina]PWV72425.1 PAS domain S-box-containing protein [Prauserella marina]SDD80362.1 PAS domain S-box-containing protein [Prauserella marina]
MHVSPKSWSLARQLLVLQLVLVGVLVAGGLALAYVDAVRAADDKAADEVTSVAATLADSPGVRLAVSGPDPSAELQPFVEQVRADTGVDFITIMDTDGVRHTHPNPELIGQTFVGNTAEALAGRPFTETYTGTLGPSVRTVTPVFDGEGTVVALVAVGITVEAITAELRERLEPLLIVAGGVLAVGVAGSWLVSARLRRQTRGVAPAELSGMFEYYTAILHAVREGLVLIGRDGRVVLCNDAARELLGLSGDVRGESVAELGLAGDLVDTMTSTRRRGDEVHVTETRVLLVNTVQVRSDDRAMGNVVTLRDHTELQGLTGELDTVRGFAESLRAQAHESANKLHAVVSLVETGRGEQAVELATAELATAQQLTDKVVGAVSEPVLAALLLGKSSEASERGAELVLTEDTAMDDTSALLDSRDLITILGNLIDNAIDAAIEGAAERAPRVVVTVRTPADELFLRVADSGGGIAPGVAQDIFRKGWSTKPGGEQGRGLGLALVGQTVRRHGGVVSVGNGDDGAAQDSGAVFTIRIPLTGRARAVAVTPGANQGGR